MSYLVTCGHCSRLFLPSSSIHLCPECAPAHARLEAECARRPDPLTALAEAKSRIRGLKRHRDLRPPENFGEVLPWLLFHPHVRITGPTPPGDEPVSRDEAFMAFLEGVLYFKGADGLDRIPIDCERIGVIDRAETPISFDAAGFTIYRFGCHIRVEYQL